MNKLRVVLDTNILLVSLPSKSKYRLIFDRLITSGFELYITNEIISEYIEIIGNKTTGTIALNVIELLLNIENVNKTEVYFRWGLINVDNDDNKFVDCAIASNADFIVTNDKHFNVLKAIKFPKVKVVSIDKFMDFLLKESK